MKCFTAGLGGFGCLGDLGKGKRGGTKPLAKPKSAGKLSDAAKHVLAGGKFIADQFARAVRAGDQALATAIATNPHAGYTQDRAMGHPDDGSVQAWNQGIADLPESVKSQQNAKWAKLVASGQHYLARSPIALHGLGAQPFDPFGGLLVPVPQQPQFPKGCTNEGEFGSTTPLYAVIDPGDKHIVICQWPSGGLRPQPY